MPLTPKQEFYLQNELLSEISYQKEMNSRIRSLSRKLKKLEEIQETKVLSFPIGEIQTQILNSARKELNLSVVNSPILSPSRPYSARSVRTANQRENHSSSGNSLNSNNSVTNFKLGYSFNTNQSPSHYKLNSPTNGSIYINTGEIKNPNNSSKMINEAPNPINSSISSNLIDLVEYVEVPLRHESNSFLFSPPQHHALFRIASSANEVKKSPIHSIRSFSPIDVLLKTSPKHELPPDYLPTSSRLSSPTNKSINYLKKKD